MNPAAAERGATAALLLVCALCCLGVANWARDLDAANARRGEQLALFRELLREPHRAPPGPIAALDGLFVKRVVRREGPGGPVLDFATATGGEP